VTREPGAGLGPLGRRLLAAFVLVALSSVIVLTVAALIGTARGLTAGEDDQRTAAAQATASAAALAYDLAGGWGGADMSGPVAIAGAAGAGLQVWDAAGDPVAVPVEIAPDSMMQGMGRGSQGRGGVTAPVVVDGATVGTVRLGFGVPSTSTAQSIAWAWILVAAVAALLVAFLMAWYVSGRISRPLVRLSAASRAFAAGDRTARSLPADSSAPGELGALARAFDSTADEVVRSEEARRRMSADIAHELRTPLAALQAGLEELRDGLVVPDSERIAALHAQSVRLGRVVGDLAELSSAESAALSLRRVPVDLGRLIEDAARSARPSFDAAGIDLDCEAAPHVIVNADADRLHQAVGNLLANAVRYCRPGDSVVLRVMANDGTARVTVADTGPGIGRADLPHVFERLWRGAADRGDPGSGIGLAVVRELVAAHGGSVSVDSDGTSGATFTVLLPTVETAVRGD